MLITPSKMLRWHWGRLSTKHLAIARELCVWETALRLWTKHLRMSRWIYLAVPTRSFRQNGIHLISVKFPQLCSHTSSSRSRSPPVVIYMRVYCMVVMTITRQRHSSRPGRAPWTSQLKLTRDAQERSHPQKGHCRDE